MPRWPWAASSSPSPRSSFLGYGIRLPTPSWGNMLSDVNTYFLQQPLLAFYPGLCILLTVVSINFMGDALRDALDPRLKM